MNTLPRYWAVKYDGSSRYRHTVLKYLNDTYGTDWGGGYQYYGYDGSADRNGSRAHDSLKSFYNLVVVLTLDEFDACLKGVNFSIPIIVSVPKI